MSDTIITTYGLGGYQVFLDADTVTTTAGQGNALRQRIQISARDITTGTPTDVGDASNRALRVNVVQGVTTTGTVTSTQGTSPWVVTFTAPTFFPLPITLSSQWPATTTFLPVTFTNPAISGVTVTGWTFPGSITTTGAATPNVTVTNWTYGGAITVTGAASNPNVTVTQWTAPQTVSITGTLPATLTNLPATPTLFLAVTHTNPQLAAGSAQIGTVTSTQGTTPWTVTLTTLPVTVSGVAVVTYSQGTQLVSATQGTNPWAVTQTSSPWWVEGTIPATLSSLTATPTLFLPVTFTNPTVTFSAGTQVVSLSNALPWAVTQSFGTLAVTQSGNTWLVTQSGAPWLVSATQGTNPWVITFSGTQPVSLSQVVLSSNVAATSPTGPAVQVATSLIELLAPIFQVVSTTAASATIIPGVAGKRIWVTGYHVVASQQTNLTWIDSSAPPAGLTGTMAIATSSGVSAYGAMNNPVMAVVTPGNSLKLSQSGAANLGGVVTAYQF